MTSHSSSAVEIRVLQDFGHFIRKRKDLWVTLTSDLSRCLFFEGNPEKKLLMKFIHKAPSEKRILNVSVNDTQTAIIYSDSVVLVDTKLFGKPIDVSIAGVSDIVFLNNNSTRVVRDFNDCVDIFHRSTLIKRLNGVTHILSVGDWQLAYCTVDRGVWIGRPTEAGRKISKLNNVVQMVNLGGHMLGIISDKNDLFRVDTWRATSVHMHSNVASMVPSGSLVVGLTLLDGTNVWMDLLNGKTRKIESGILAAVSQEGYATSRTDGRLHVYRYPKDDLA